MSKLKMGSGTYRLAERDVEIPDEVVGGEAVAAAVVDGGDWRSLLQPDSRTRIVNKILQTLERNLPFLQVLPELNADVRFQEKSHVAATGQKMYGTKILRRHLPSYGLEGEQELVKVAFRLEEKIYNAAMNQSDYLRKLSLKMLTIESKCQRLAALQSNAPRG